MKIINKISLFDNINDIDKNEVKNVYKKIKISLEKIKNKKNINKKREEIIKFQINLLKKFDKELAEELNNQFKKIIFN